MIDAHIHLDQYNETLLDKEIELWRAKGIEKVMAVSSGLASSYKTLELQQKYPDFVYACVGFHPEHPLPNRRDIEEWKTLIKRERQRIKGIGEIGLPHYNAAFLPHTIEHSLEFFSECIETATSYELPVALHAVHDKAQLALNVLKEFKVKLAHFHWLKAPENVVQQIIAEGYYVSVTPEVCYKKRDEILASQIRDSQLLIETDGPWKFEDQFKQKPTTPLLLDEMINKLVTIKSQKLELLRQQILENTKRCYKL